MRFELLLLLLRIVITGLLLLRFLRDLQLQLLLELLLIPFLVLPLPLLLLHLLLLLLDGLQVADHVLQ